MFSDRQGKKLFQEEEIYKKYKINEIKM